MSRQPNELSETGTIPSYNYLHSFSCSHHTKNIEELLSQKKPHSSIIFSAQEKFKNHNFKEYGKQHDGIIFDQSAPCIAGIPVNFVSNPAFQLHSEIFEDKSPDELFEDMHSLVQERKRRSNSGKTISRLKPNGASILEKVAEIPNRDFNSECFILMRTADILHVSLGNYSTEEQLRNGKNPLICNIALYIQKLTEALKIAIYINEEKQKILNDPQKIQEIITSEEKYIFQLEERIRFYEKANLKLQNLKNEQDFETDPDWFHVVINRNRKGQPLPDPFEWRDKNIAKNLKYIQNIQEEIAQRKENNHQEYWEVKLKKAANLVDYKAMGGQFAPVNEENVHPKNHEEIIKSSEILEKKDFEQLLNRIYVFLQSNTVNYVESDNLSETIDAQKKLFQEILKLYFYPIAKWSIYSKDHAQKDMQAKIIACHQALEFLLKSSMLEEALEIYKITKDRDGEPIKAFSSAQKDQAMEADSESFDAQTHQTKRSKEEEDAMPLDLVPQALLAIQLATDLCSIRHNFYLISKRIVVKASNGARYLLLDAEFILQAPQDESNENRQSRIALLSAEINKKRRENKCLQSVNLYSSDEIVQLINFIKGTSVSGCLALFILEEFLKHEKDVQEKLSEIISKIDAATLKDMMVFFYEYREFQLFAKSRIIQTALAISLDKRYQDEIRKNPFLNEELRCWVDNLSFLSALGHLHQAHQSENLVLKKELIEALNNQLESEGNTINETRLFPFIVKFGDPKIIATVIDIDIITQPQEEDYRAKRARDDALTSAVLKLSTFCRANFLPSIISEDSLGLYNDFLPEQYIASLITSHLAMKMSISLKNNISNQSPQKLLLNTLSLIVKEICNISLANFSKKEIKLSKKYSSPYALVNSLIPIFLHSEASMDCYSVLFKELIFNHSNFIKSFLTSNNFLSDEQKFNALNTLLQAVMIYREDDIYEGMHNITNQGQRGDNSFLTYKNYRNENSSGKNGVVEMNSLDYSLVKAIVLLESEVFTSEETLSLFELYPASQVIDCMEKIALENDRDKKQQSAILAFSIARIYTLCPDLFLRTYLEPQTLRKLQSLFYNSTAISDESQSEFLRYLHKNSHEVKSHTKTFSAIGFAKVLDEAFKGKGQEYSSIFYYRFLKKEYANCPTFSKEIWQTFESFMRKDSGQSVFMAIEDSKDLALLESLFKQGQEQEMSQGNKTKFLIELNLANPELFDDFNRIILMEKGKNYVEKLSIIGSCDDVIILANSKMNLYREANKEMRVETFNEAIDQKTSDFLDRLEATKKAIIAQEKVNKEKQKEASHQVLLEHYRLVAQNLVHLKATWMLIGGNIGNINKLKHLGVCFQNHEFLQGKASLEKHIQELKTLIASSNYENLEHLEELLNDDSHNSQEEIEEEFKEQETYADQAEEHFDYVDTRLSSRINAPATINIIPKTKEKSLLSEYELLQSKKELEEHYIGAQINFGGNQEILDKLTIIFKELNNQQYQFWLNLGTFQHPATQTTNAINILNSGIAKFSFPKTQPSDAPNSLIGPDGKDKEILELAIKLSRMNFKFIISSFEERSDILNNIKDTPTKSTQDAIKLLSPGFSLFQYISSTSTDLHNITDFFLRSHKSFATLGMPLFLFKSWFNMMISERRPMQFKPFSEPTIETLATASPEESQDQAQQQNPNAPTLQIEQAKKIRDLEKQLLEQRKTLLQQQLEQIKQQEDLLSQQKMSLQQEMQHLAPNIFSQQASAAAAAPQQPLVSGINASTASTVVPNSQSKRP